MVISMAKVVMVDGSYIDVTDREQLNKRLTIQRCL